MALSEADKQLTEEQQKQIQAYKDQWAAANASGDQAAMDAAHAGAEAIRAQAAGGGYSGGADGSGYTLLSGAGASGGSQGAAQGAAQGAGQGTTPTINGMTADQMANWVNDYNYTNYDASSGWTNGYSIAMNQRSIANKIRQQMQANSEAWASADAATQAYLHEQNMQLAKLLADSVGGAESTYNEQLGRWETYNSNLGYGVDMNFAPGTLDREFAKNTYGMTDEQMDKYFTDTDHYRNYVDQHVVQNWYDPSSGYNGIYSQFVNGPYGRLLAGTNGVNQEWYMDVQGDGFAEGSYADMLQNYQENGPVAPPLKNNNGLSDYTKQFASYVDENGIIQPGQLQLTHRGGGSPVVGDGSYSGVSAPIGYAGGITSDGQAYKPATNIPDSVYTNQPNKYNAERNVWWKNAHAGSDPNAVLQQGIQTNPLLQTLPSYGGAPVYSQTPNANAGGDGTGDVTSGNPYGGNRPVTANPDWSGSNFLDQFVPNNGTGTGSGTGTGTGGSTGGTTINWPSLSEAGSIENYLQMMYAANLQSQTLALQQAYEKNLADLATAEEQAAAAYADKQRQTAGQSAQQAAGWREVANAMGLNSGTFGQAALAQNNQLQSDLTTLNAAQAQSQAELERQRALLGQEYQNAILKAQADNNMELAYALYQEAVRQDEALRQQQQFEASLAADLTSQLLGMAGSLSGGSSGSRSSASAYSYTPNYDATPTADNTTPTRDELLYQLRSAGSQLNKTTDPNEKTALENSIYDALDKLVGGGYMTEGGAEVWMKEYGIYY